MNSGSGFFHQSHNKTFEPLSKILYSWYYLYASPPLSKSQKLNTRWKMINKKIKGKETVNSVRERERGMDPWGANPCGEQAGSSAPVEKEEEKAKHSLGNKWIL